MLCSFASLIFPNLAVGLCRLNHSVSQGQTSLEPQTSDRQSREQSREECASNYLLRRQGSE